MTRILLSSLLLTSVLVSCMSNSPGITGSVDLNLFLEAKELYTQMIINDINNTPFPDFIFENNQGYLKRNSLGVGGNTDNVQMKVIDNSTFELSLQRFYLDFISRSFKYTMVLFPVHGDCRVRMKNTWLLVHVKLNERPSEKHGGRSVPYFTVSYADMRIGTQDMEISMGGGFLASFYNLFVWLFDTDLRDEIERAVEYHLQRDLPKMFNDMFLTEDGYFYPSKNPVYQNLSLDYSFETKPLLYGNYLGLGFNGTMANDGKPVYIPPIMPF